MQAPYVQATLDGSSLAAAIADAPDHSATISLEIAPLTQSTGPPDDDQGPPVLAIKFAHTDLAAIANLVGLQTVCSDKQHDGSNRLYLLEQMTFLDSLSSITPALKKRPLRHKHFWRDAEKLPVKDRVFVLSTALESAIQTQTSVTPCLHLSPAEHCSGWTACLTSTGAMEYLNRKISPIGVRLFRSLQAQMEAQQQTMQLQQEALAGQQQVLQMQQDKLCQQDELLLMQQAQLHHQQPKQSSA